MRTQEMQRKMWYLYLGMGEGIKNSSEPCELRNYSFCPLLSRIQHISTRETWWKDGAMVVPQCCVALETFWAILDKVILSLGISGLMQADSWYPTDQGKMPGASEPARPAGSPTLKILSEKYHHFLGVGETLQVPRSFMKQAAERIL
jgi:hypothetical protein